MPKRVNIGIIGSGFATHFHLASYRKVHGHAFDIAAIAGRNTQAVAALADSYGVRKRYAAIDELLADPEIDMIDICVPNHLHAGLAVRIAEAGKHIICEKPLGGYFGPAGAPDTWTAEGFSRQTMVDAVNEEIARVRAAVTKAGVTFCYAENWVYAPPIAKVGRLMAASDSAIMRITGEESHSGSHGAYSRRWRTAGGGSLLRLGVHPIGAALHLKAEEGRRRNGRAIRPRSVQAETARLTGMAAFQAQTPKHMVTGWVDVEDWSAVTITFDDGSVAQLSASDTRMGGIHNTLTAIGSRAVVTAHINPNTSCQAYTPDGAYFESEYIVEKTETKGGWSFPAPDEDMITGYPEELTDFIGAVAEGRAPKSGLDLACDVLAVVYAAYLGAEQGRRIDVAASMSG